MCLHQVPELQPPVPSLRIKGKPNKPFSLFVFFFFFAENFPPSFCDSRDTVAPSPQAQLFLSDCAAFILTIFLCSRTFIFSVSPLDKEVLIPTIKEITLNGEKERVRRGGMTAETDHSLSKSQGTLTVRGFSSRNHRN